MIWLAETSSTNDEARALALAGAAHGTAVAADHQTAGRGRLGRRWVAPAGANVLLSIVLRDGLPTDRLGVVALAAAVAVAEACGPDWRLKWPNDVVAADGRKLAGILLEAEWAGGAPAFVVAGIGVNVHARPLDVPAVTLAEVGTAPDRRALAEAVVDGVLRWVARGPDAVLVAWRARAATLGQRVAVAGIEGIAVDVGGDGALIVETGQGRQLVRAGDVQMVG